MTDKTTTTDIDPDEARDAATMATFSGFVTQDGAVVPEKPAGKAAEGDDKAADDKGDEGDGDDKGAEGDDKGDGKDGKADDDDSEAGKARRSAQERINKAVGAQRAAERREADQAAANALLVRQLDEMRARLERIEKGETGKDLTKPEAKDTVDPDAPNPKDYPLGELDARYIAAVSAHAVKKALAEADEGKRKSQETAQETAAREALAAQVRELGTKGAKVYPDFDETVLKAAARNEYPVTDVVGSLILESEQGVHVAYELATDLELAKKVAAMTPTRQGAWFGAREAFYEAKAGQGADTDDGGEPPVTKAPPVPDTRIRAGRSAPAVTADTGDFAAFEAAYRSSQKSGR